MKYFAKDKKRPAKPFSFITLLLIILSVFSFKDSILDNNNIASSSMVPNLYIGDYVLVNKMRYSLRVPFFDWIIWQYDDPKRGDVITFLPEQSYDRSRHYVKRVIALPDDRIRLKIQKACPRFAELNCKPDEKFTITQVEYKVQDRGEWHDFHLQSLPKKTSDDILNQSDDANVLDPQYWPVGYRHFRNHLFQNTITETKGNHNLEKNFILNESSFKYGETFLCPSIYTSGCLLEDDQFFVMGDNRDNSEDSRIIGPIRRSSIRGKAQWIYFSIHWRDGICSDYWSHFGKNANKQQTPIGFSLPDFDETQQQKWCTADDAKSVSSALFLQRIDKYFYHTFSYRIFRMQVRWSRIASKIY